MATRVVSEEQTPEEKKAAAATRAFYAACAKDEQLRREVEVHALAAPLTWGLSVLNVDALGLDGLKMLIVSMGGFGIEDCVVPSVIVARAQEALEGQVFCSGCWNGSCCFVRSFYLRALATIVQTAEPIDLNNPPSVLDLIKGPE